MNTSMNTFAALALTSTGLLIFYVSYLMTSVFKLKAPVYHVYMGTPAHSSYLDDYDVEEEEVDEGEVNDDVDMDLGEESEEVNEEVDAENADDEGGEVDAENADDEEGEVDEEEDNAENADDESEDLNTDFTPILPLTSLTDHPLEDDIRSPAYAQILQETKNFIDQEQLETRLQAYVMNADLINLANQADLEALRDQLKRLETIIDSQDDHMIFMKKQLTSIEFHESQIKALAGTVRRIDTLEKDQSLFDEQATSKINYLSASLDNASQTFDSFQKRINSLDTVIKNTANLVTMISGDNPLFKNDLETLKNSLETLKNASTLQTMKNQAWEGTSKWKKDEYGLVSCGGNLLITIIKKKAMTAAENELWASWNGRSDHTTANRDSYLGLSDEEGWYIYEDQSPKTAKKLYIKNDWDFSVDINFTLTFEEAAYVPNKSICLNILKTLYNQKVIQWKRFLIPSTL
jgi:hypothetical protein